MPVAFLLWRLSPTIYHWISCISFRKDVYKINNIVLSGNSISFPNRSQILTSTSQTKLFVYLFVCLYAFNFCGYYCIYVYIEGLMED